MKLILPVKFEELDVIEYLRIGRTPWQKVSKDDERKYNHLEVRLAQALAAAYTAAFEFEQEEGFTND